MNWKDYRIFLDRKGKWKKFNRDGKPSRPATDDDIKKVLADVTDLRLKGEFGTFNQVGCLGYVIFGADDELHLVPSDKPPPKPEQTKATGGSRFAAQSKWTGFVKHRKAGKESSVDVVVTVTKRDGKSFEGTYETEGGEYRCLIEGRVEENAVGWKYTKIEKEKRPLRNLVGVEVKGTITIEPKTNKPRLVAHYDWPDADNPKIVAKGTIELTSQE
jgi:hypothetical protein